MSGGNTMDTVIHDGAPNVGGVWSSEAYQQSWLVLEALKLASEFLAPKGTFITKIFRCAFLPNFLAQGLANWRHSRVHTRHRLLDIHDIGKFEL